MYLRKIYDLFDLQYDQQTIYGFEMIPIIISSLLTIRKH